MHSGSDYRKVAIRNLLQDYSHKDVCINYRHKDDCICVFIPIYVLRHYVLCYGVMQRLKFMQYEKLVCVCIANNGIRCVK